VIDETPRPPEDVPAAEQARTTRRARPRRPGARSGCRTAAPAAPESDDDDEAEPARQARDPGATWRFDIVLEVPTRGHRRGGRSRRRPRPSRTAPTRWPVAAVIDLAAGARYRATGKRKDRRSPA